MIARGEQSVNAAPVALSDQGRREKFQAPGQIRALKLSLGLMQKDKTTNCNNKIQ